MTWFFMGLGIGLLLAIPFVVAAMRYESKRVRRLELRARGAERLAELGRLTGGLAHEIKNPLSTVGLNVQLLQEDLGDWAQHSASPTTAATDQVRRIQTRFATLASEIRRLRQILEDFLQFAGRVKLHRVDADVNALVGELADFYAPQADSASIHLRLQCSAQPATAPIDTSLLKQALLNLLINATQAMGQARQAGEPSGGNDELIIRTENTRVLGQDEIHIHVTDTGPGIPADVLEKVFQPYYSTKKGGTGLGLPTARRIIEEHGGTLTVHAEPGRGTDFLVTLPVDPSPSNLDAAIAEVNRPR